MVYWVLLQTGKALEMSLKIEKNCHKNSSESEITEHNAKFTNFNLLSMKQCETKRFRNKTMRTKSKIENRNTYQN